MTLQKRGQNRDSCDSDSRSGHNPISDLDFSNPRSIKTKRVQRRRHDAEQVPPHRQRRRRRRGLLRDGDLRVVAAVRHVSLADSRRVETRTSEIRVILSFCLQQNHAGQWETF